jgi:hypothetical protein
MKRLAFTALMLAPQIAAACPQCAGRGDAKYVSLLIGGMCVLPFVVTTFVWRAIRRAGESTR